jgi:hypothetical protein
MLKLPASHVKLSAGKQRGLDAISTDSGIIAALAIDQSSALRKLFADSSGVAGRSPPHFVSRPLTAKEALTVLSG